MTPEQIAELEALAAKAVPGPYSEKELYGAFYVVGADEMILAHCYKGLDQSFILRLLNNLPAIIAALKAQQPDEAMVDLLSAAYDTGATDVHNSWVEGTNDAEPDFGEAANDYARAVVAACRRAAMTADRRREASAGCITRDEAATLYRASWASLMKRGDAFTRCDRFRYEPPNGIGATAGMGHLWGYRGEDCLLYTACVAAGSGQ